MPESRSDDRSLARLIKICLALPEAEHQPMGDHSSFSVRKKKFAYFLNDHHGDGIVSVCFRTESGENEVLLASDQTRVLQPRLHRPERLGRPSPRHRQGRLGRSRRFRHRKLPPRRPKRLAATGHNNRLMTNDQ